MGLDFSFKYLLYFLRFITPLSSKSLAAQLNSSKDKGSGFISLVLNFGVGFTVVEGLSVAI